MDKASTQNPKTVVAKSTVPKPTVTKPAVTKPVVTKPVVSKPIEKKAVVSKPIETKNPVAKPVATKNIAEKPAVSKPVVAKPVVTKPVVTKSPVLKPEVTKPSISKPVAKKTVQAVTKTVDNPPKAQPKAKEEVKQENKPKVQNAPAVLIEHDAKLTESTTIVDKIWAKDKIPLIIDHSDNFSTFLKYKGTIVDISEHLIKLAVDKEYGNSEFFENSRKKIVYALKSGSLLAFFFDNFSSNFNDLFKEAGYFKELNKFLTPSLLKNKEYYKPTFLKPEEDVDNFGNRGYFEADKEFKHCFVFGSKTTKVEIKEKVGLPMEHFELVNLTA